MQNMWINYVLLGIFGLFSLISIIQRVRRGYFIGGRAGRTVASLIVFILALVATVMNVPITELKTAIERMFQPRG